MTKRYYREKIIVNKIKCNLCGDEIESTSGHDFKYCKCGAVYIDGGKRYLRRGGDLNSITDLSVVEQEEREPYDWEK